jgi:hypothetical protein
MTDKVFKYSEERRHDPVLLEKVARVHMARNRKLREVARILRELRDDMWGLQIQGDESAIYERNVAAVSSASHTLSRDAEFMNRDSWDNFETYHGNLAAGLLGYRISQMSNEEFDRKFPKEEKDNG